MVAHFKKCAFCQKLVIRANAFRCQNEHFRKNGQRTTFCTHGPKSVRNERFSERACKKWFVPRKTVPNNVFFLRIPQKCQTQEVFEKKMSEQESVRANTFRVRNRQKCRKRQQNCSFFRTLSRPLKKCSECYHSLSVFLKTRSLLTEHFSCSRGSEQKTVPNGTFFVTHQNQIVYRKKP